MKKHQTPIIAGLILIFAFIVAFTSMLGDSMTMDEVAHLPAGYSYVVKQDMRLNPEHPPLLKDLSGLSVWLGSKISGLPITFPENIKAWTSEINSQWDFGFSFMYEVGNDAQAMLLWGRLPFLLLFLLLGIYVFRWTRELYGDKAALIATLLFSFSPTVLAHSRLVTTDLGAAAAFFIALYYFTHWLKNPDWKNTIKAGLVFGLALLVKFSTFLIVPLFVFLTLLYVLLKKESRSFFKRAFVCFGKLLTLGLLGVVFVVTPVYQYHVWHYSAEMQQRDMEHILNKHPMPWLADMVKWTADKPVVRAFGEYMFGLSMVYQRATGGNTTYFLGEVSNSGWRNYFPVVYLIKETLALHLLTLIAVFYLLTKILRRCLPGTNKDQSGWRHWLLDKFPQLSMLAFLALYWYTSIFSSNLNIGVRHILPTFPFVFLLIGGQISLWLKRKGVCPCAWIKNAVVTVLLLWGIGSVLLVYPSFLAYFNELAGGPENGHKYVVDSNLDWGQDLKRLKSWADANGVDKIYIDYFGGTAPDYYFGERALEWHGNWPREQMTQADYLALSLTFRQNDLGQPASDFHTPIGFYQWLADKEPVAKIGHSIWVYKLR